jgi:uncharacterized protein Yka (UPF0111/DUF47 family)
MIRLLPQETKFFDLFEAQVAKVLEAARALEEMARHYEHVVEKARHIKVLETQSDHITHDIIDKLNRTFITPFDREDIHDLGTALDDDVDLIDATASRAVLFRVGGEVPEAAGLAGVLKRQAGEILVAVSHLKEPEHILEQCKRIKDMETEGDRLYREAMVRLFAGTPDPIFVIKAKEIIEVLETATDAGDRVAIVLERIVLKSQ